MVLHVSSSRMLSRKRSLGVLGSQGGSRVYAESESQSREGQSAVAATVQATALRCCFQQVAGQNVCSARGTFPARSRAGKAGSRGPAEGFSRSGGEKSCSEAWHWVPREASEVAAKGRGEDCLRAAGRRAGEPSGCSRPTCNASASEERLKLHVPQRAGPAYFSHFLEDAPRKPGTRQPSSVLETHLLISAKGAGNLRARGNEGTTCAPRGVCMYTVALRVA